MTSELIHPEPDAELADLVSRYLDSRLDADQRARLEARIQNEPAALEYLAQRLRFEATLRESISPQRMEVLESRRMIMEPGAGGPEWSVEQQRSVRIGGPEKPTVIEVAAASRKRVRFTAMAAILLAITSATWFLWPRRPPPVPASPPPLVLRNPDFEATDLSLTPQGFTSTLVDWQEAFACPEAELVEIARVTQGKVFAKSGKNVARLQPGGYINQFLKSKDGTPLKARDGLNVRLSGWAWSESERPNTMSASLRVVASGRPDTILYDACRSEFTLLSAGWQRFRVDLPVTGDLMRVPYWVEARVSSKPPLDLTGRDLCLSIDMHATTTPILLDDLKIEEVPSNDTTPLSPVTFELHHSDAGIRGTAIRQPDKDFIGSWEDDTTTVAWTVRFHRPGEIDIECLQAAEARSAGNGYDIIIGNAKVAGRVVDTGAWDQFQLVKVGRLMIPAAGEYEIVVAPHPKDNQAVMNLRGLRLSGSALSAEIVRSR